MLKNGKSHDIFFTELMCQSHKIDPIVQHRYDSAWPKCLEPVSVQRYLNALTGKQRIQVKKSFFVLHPASLVQYYHVTSNGHISANFWKYGMKFFLEPQKMLYLQNRKKNWVPWPLHIVFRSMNSKTCFFLAIFGFWGQISPWSRLGRATKFYRKKVALIRNFHVKFEGIPTIFVVTMKKKLNTFR